MKQRGFRFGGPTIGYACVRAVGIVNDHHCALLSAQRA
jgi:3-methyladenine DNA glycosylase Tag